MAIPATAGRRLAELLQLQRLRPAALAQARGAAGSPAGKMGHEDLVPEERGEEDENTGKPRRSDLEAERRGKELGESPENYEGDHKPRQHGRDPPRPLLNHAEYTHYPGALSIERIGGSDF